MYTTYDSILRYILNLGFKDFILFFTSEIYDTALKKNP